MAELAMLANRGRLNPSPTIMYTSPLSTLISSLSLNHHLYADDTQLFLLVSQKVRTPGQNPAKHISYIIRTAKERTFTI